MVPPLDEKESDVSYSKHLSEIRNVNNVYKLNINGKSDENGNPKGTCRDAKEDINTTIGAVKGRKVSNSIFFLSNGMFNGLESHQLSGRNIN